MRILTVEANSTKRQLLNQEFRSRGYADVTGVANNIDGLELLSKEHFDWALLPFSITDKPNALQILDQALNSKPMADLDITFILQDDPQKLSPHLKKAFDLGLLSFMGPYNSKIDIGNEFQKLFALVDLYKGYQPFIAGSYLRELLTKEQNFAELLSFEKSLNLLSLEHPEILIHFAEACCLNNNKKQATTICEQALTLSPDLAPRIKTLKATYKLDESQSSTGESLNILHIDDITILDPDEASLSTIEALLQKTGIPKINKFSSASQAHRFLEQQKKSSMIITEWQLDDIPGPIFCQKVRDLGIKSPIVVLNAELDPKDLPILREMGITHFIKKPLTDDRFYREIFWVVNQDRLPTEPFMIREKLKQAQQENNLKKVAELKRSYFNHPRVTDIDRHEVNAEISYNAGFFHKAKQYATEALQMGGDSVQILNLLGKALMQLREFEGALRCLENAQIISPTNIERLCCIAESHLELGDDTKYQETILKAEDLDHNSKKVKKTEAKAAIKHGEHDKAKTLMKQLDSLKDIVAFTNNRAVALIRTEHLSAGIKLYEDAAESMPETEKEILATLFYNLGLAEVRTKNLESAFRHLKKAEELKTEKLEAKVSSLKKRVEQSLISGKPIKLREAQTRTVQSDSESAQKYMDEMEAILNSLERSPGSHNLHMVYNFSMEGHKDVAKLLEKKAS